MRLFKKVAIIGVGLIGGSVGLGLRRRRMAGCVIGVCRHKSSLVKARSMGAIDIGTLDIKEAVEDADLVILATPVNDFAALARNIAPFLKKGAIITDVGSTKRLLVNSLEKLFGKNNPFIGTHPLAGSEKKGVSEARGNLFEGAVCIVTRTKRTNITGLEKISRLWEVLGSKVVVMDTQRHDRILASVSHLPHIVANALILSVDTENFPFAAGGLRDTTRIASSDPTIWQDIFLTNRHQLLLTLKRFEANLRKLRLGVKQGDEKLLFSLLNKAKQKRDLLENRNI